MNVLYINFLFGYTYLRRLPTFDEQMQFRLGQLDLAEFYDKFGPLLSECRSSLKPFNHEDLRATLPEDMVPKEIWERLFSAINKVWLFT